jgi:hypothetical protein
MVEKVNALCNAIDTLNSLTHTPARAANVNELAKLLLAECKQMVEPPTVERVYEAGNRIEQGDPLLIVGDKVYSTRKSVQVVKAPVSRPAETEPAMGYPDKPESNEGFHTLVPPTPKNGGSDSWIANEYR